MENNSLENPWNLKLQSFEGKNNENKYKVLLKHGVVTRFSFLKNMPHLFNKFDNLVLCNICQNLICKKSSFKHAKLHNSPNEVVGFLDHIPSKIEIPNVQELITSAEILKKRSKKSLNLKAQVNTKEKRCKVINERSIKLTNSADCEIIDDYDGDIKLNNNFVPKSTLNAANPLRIRIQLQPKSETAPRNGNIFENLNNFYNFKNNNLSRKSTVNGEIEINNTNVSNVPLMRMKEHNHTTTNRVITIKKFHSSTEQRTNLAMSQPTPPRPCGIPIISHSMQDYLRHPNQTSSSLPSQIRRDSPQLSQQPKVFQTFRQETFPGRSSQKKYVEVKSLPESQVPVTSTQSQSHPLTASHDQTQKSFQKILIENGMFSLEDIKRAQKPNYDRHSMPDISHTGRIRRGSNIPIRLMNNNKMMIRPRMSNSSSMIRQYSQRPQNPMKDPFMATPQSLHSTATNNVHSHVNNRRTNINQHKYPQMELSDDEFFLDPTVFVNRNGQKVYPSTSSLHLESQYAQSNPNSVESSSIGNKTSSHQSTALCPDNYRSDVHYLPPPDEVITSLSWEQ